MKFTLKKNSVKDGKTSRVAPNASATGELYILRKIDSFEELNEGDQLYINSLSWIKTSPVINATIEDDSMMLETRTSFYTLKKEEE